MEVGVLHLAHRRNLKRIGEFIVGLVLFGNLFGTVQTHPQFIRADRKPLKQIEVAIGEGDSALPVIDRGHLFALRADQYAGAVPQLKTNDERGCDRRVSEICDSHVQIDARSDLKRRNRLQAVHLCGQKHRLRPAFQPTIAKIGRLVPRRYIHDRALGEPNRPLERDSLHPIVISGAWRKNGRLVQKGGAQFGRPVIYDLHGGSAIRGGRSVNSVLPRIGNDRPRKLDPIRDNECGEREHIFAPAARHLCRTARRRTSDYVPRGGTNPIVVCHAVLKSHVILIVLAGASTRRDRAMYLVDSRKHICRGPVDSISGRPADRQPGKRHAQRTSHAHHHRCDA